MLRNFYDSQIQFCICKSCSEPFKPLTIHEHFLGHRFCVFAVLRKEEVTRQCPMDIRMGLLAVLKTSEHDSKF